MDDLAPQEAAVLDQISRNPFAGQQEIADALGIARSTVAAHVVQLIKKGYILGRGYVLPTSGQVLCIGGAVFDRKYRALQPLVAETSNPVEAFHSFGGVARNVVENLARLGEPVGFVSILGDDQTGHHILGHLRDQGVDVSRVIIAPDATTAEYGAILTPAGELALGIADMAIFDRLTPAALSRVWSHVAGAAWVFADANLPAETLAALIRRHEGGRYQLTIDGVSTHKIRKLPADLSGIDLLFMNADEAAALLDLPVARDLPEALDAARAAVARGAKRAQVSMGAQGLAIAGDGYELVIPAVPAASVDITGAGDAMVAGTLHALVSGHDFPTAARTGALMGALTVETPGTVRADLGREMLETHARSRLTAPSAAAPAPELTTPTTPTTPATA
ncbi:carbohydrate kinase [Frigidibacter sp. MR17.24]|uniref:carbohydrate kinase n=1 Tax=Frigidibacter sp. MR17.24 TaxID=3127345 RepID=UPI0030130C0E